MKQKISARKPEPKPPSQFMQDAPIAIAMALTASGFGRIEGSGFVYNNDKYNAQKDSEIKCK